MKYWLAGWITLGIVPIFLACLEEPPNEITVRDALVALVSLVLGPVALFGFICYAITDEGLDWGSKVIWRRAESSPTDRSKRKP